YHAAGWRSLGPLARWAIVTGVWIVIALILVGTFGVVEWTRVAGAAMIFGLVVVPYERLPFGRFVVPAAVIALAVWYPFYRGSVFGWPIFGTFPAMSTMVVITVFVIMALGLYVVVGFAGLLVLGLV